MLEAPESPFVRISDREARAMLITLAKLDQRNYGQECAWLIRQEYARRLGLPANTPAQEPVSAEHPPKPEANQLNIFAESQQA